MIKYTPDLVSTPEYHLIEAVREIRFGELFGVQVDDQPKWVDCELSEAERDLIQFIRDGAQHIDILTVHNGQPALAETEMKINGFRCRKKVRFPAQS